MRITKIRLVDQCFVSPIFNHSFINQPFVRCLDIHACLDRLCNFSTKLADNDQSFHNHDLSVTNMISFMFDIFGGLV